MSAGRWACSAHLHMKTLARLLWLSVTSLFVLGAVGKEPVTASHGRIELPTYPWMAVKHPYFRGTDGRNIYPYPMLDFLSRERTTRTYQTVVLENEFLRLTILPELGGRVHEVIDKTTGQPMFYVNNVIKPGLIGQCGAWISGGIEWNTGPQGHTVGCMQPVEVEILPEAKDGSRSVAIGEVERIYRTRWTVVVTLRPDRSFIEERIRIYNPTPTIRPYYFWNCTAVPNTRGFRFIYPMTLGTDHGAEKFFNWPTHEGKDLSHGTNYQDASSIFAWFCDQDFFGSYNDDLGRGVVSYANHHQLPGKKAWTWGYGGFGTLHQADLTDDDGPYNEVQTGPLLTQGEVGRLDPCEAVEWQEWWYPIHGIGGFTFANKDVAVNASTNAGQLRLQILGSGSWKDVQVSVASNRRPLATARAAVSPRQPADVTLDLAAALAPCDVTLRFGKAELASFRVPLDLPVRHPPEKAKGPETAAEFAQAGWQHFLFARFSEAEAQFRKAIERDAKCVEAHIGLAHLNLDRDPAAAAKAAELGVAVAPHDGRARFALAVAKDRLGDEQPALDAAWEASLDPAAAAAGRAFAGEILIRRQNWTAAVQALSAPGPWQADALCQNRLAVALAGQQRSRAAIAQTERSLAQDPLDGIARSLRGTLDGSGTKSPKAGLSPASALEAAAGYVAMGRTNLAFETLTEWTLAGRTAQAGDPLVYYWLAHQAVASLPASGGASASQPMGPEAARGFLTSAARANAREVFPYLPEAEPALRWALEQNPKDGRAALFLGHLLFHLGRHAEGRDLWKKAAELGAETVIACRALGMAAKTLDGNLEEARTWLERANVAEPADAIVARDLATILFAQADKAAAPEATRELTTRARDLLKAAFPEGKGRSDFVALLARAQNRLGQYAETASLLDSVRITIWEGAREAHDLFEEAHLELGKAHLAAGRATEALAEFNRALEYPANLATGRLENAREAHIHYLRGQALDALGKRDEARAAWRQAADEPASGDPKKDEARQKAAEALR